MTLFERAVRRCYNEGMPSPTAARDRKSIPSSDQKLWTLLDDAWFAVSRLRELELARFGLTTEQSATLGTLASRGGSATAGVLEYVTMRQPNSISTLVNRLSRMGLVSRKREKAEKRYAVSLSAKATALMAEVTNTSLESAFSCLSKREMGQLRRLLWVPENKALTLLRVPFMQYIMRGESSAVSAPGTPAPPISARNTWSVMDGTRFVIARLRELELAQFGLTVEQGSILEIMSQQDGQVTGRELEERTLRQHHSILGIVTRMTRMGLLTKVQQPGEKRHAIFMTKKGADLFDSLTNVSVEMTLAPLKPVDKERLERLLRRLDQTARGLLNAVPGPTSAGEPKTPGQHSTP